MHEGPIRFGRPRDSDAVWMNFIICPRVKRRPVICLLRADLDKRSRLPLQSWRLDEANGHGTTAHGQS